MNNQSQPGIITTVKDKTIDVVDGTEHIVKATVDATGHVITTAAKDTAKAAVSVEHAIADIVDRAVDGTKKIAVGTEHAVVAVADGAVEGVDKVGSTVIDATRHIVTKPFNGGKYAPKEELHASTK